ncbi:hypothetical protein HMPREF3110_05205 [Staphylococcus sp. HMSC10C03]|nr:hypothetical protein HMPREF3110_05205 [Staphylococcus sp. HMSC10C03]PNZ42889.1 hypothetical protein CD112_09090 [Staphylococcus simulans]
MKKDIQLYLDSDKKLTKAGNYYEVLSNPEKELTQKDIDKIKKASHIKKRMIKTSQIIFKTISYLTTINLMQTV